MKRMANGGNIYFLVSGCSIKYFIHLKFESKSHSIYFLELCVLQRLQVISDFELKPLVSFGANFLASILSCLASHPGDIFFLH